MLESDKFELLYINKASNVLIFQLKVCVLWL